MTTGKWYWENLVNSNDGGDYPQFGVVDLSANENDSSNLGAFRAIAYRRSGVIRKEGTDILSGRPTFTNGDVISVAFDANTGKVWFAKNGTWVNGSSGSAGDPAAGTNEVGSVSTAIQGYVAGGGGYSSATFSINFGQRAFVYTPPSGFVALNTQNLPEPSIKKPSAYMDVKLYSGTNASQSITGLGFSPDLIWFKNRTGTAFHGLFDSVRGRAAGLSSNVTDAESTSSAGNDLVSFDANGFTLGPVQNWNSTNGSGNSIVAWCWDESATPGFDIVTYTGNASNAARSVAHSLGVAPQLMITKGREAQVTGTDNWLVWHGSFGAGDFLSLNTTSAKSTSSSYWGNTVPTSSNFYVGGTSSNVHNESSKTYVAYLWSEVAGFSKFGSYTGNGSSDGPFVFCGFRPRWVMIKRTDGAGSWFMIDTARGSYNVVNPYVMANVSNAEATDLSWDILSNGFKLRSSYTDINTSSGTYVFAAFSEAPFKYSLAR